MTITFAFGPIKMFLNPNINLALHEAFEAVVRRGGSRHSPDSHGRMSDFMAEKLSVINSRLHNICNVYFLI